MTELTIFWIVFVNFVKCMLFAVIGQTFDGMGLNLHYFVELVVIINSQILDEFSQIYYWEVVGYNMELVDLDMH